MSRHSLSCSLRRCNGGHIGGWSCWAARVTTGRLRWLAQEPRSAPPDVVADIEGRGPLVRDEDIVVFACRDAADRERRGCQLLPAGLLVADREQVRRLGAGDAAREAVRYLARDGGPEDGFWIHLDADVLDETIMQAVDDPRPDGLAWDELVSALRTAIGSGRAVGLQVAIYNPDIDPDGSNGRGLAAAVRDALAGFADV